MALGCRVLVSIHALADSGALNQHRDSACDPIRFPGLIKDGNPLESPYGTLLAKVTS